MRIFSIKLYDRPLASMVSHAAFKKLSTSTNQSAYPEATPAFYYRSCLEVLQQFPVEQVQQAYCSILKQRIDPHTNIYLAEGEVPSYMNFSFYQSQFNKKMYLTMISNLSKNLL